MARRDGFHRIYTDALGNLYADDEPVFGAAGDGQMKNEMGFDYEFEGGFDELGEAFGDEFQMGALQRNPQMQLQRGRNPLPQRRPVKKSTKGKWMKTVLTGTQVLTAVGAYSVTMRPQFDFVSQDFTLDGSVATATITRVSFGDHTIFDNATGVPMAVVASTGFLRGLVKGARIRGGLDITVNGTVGGAGTVIVTMIGLKPQTTC
jgi:hypothetical protein